MNKTRALIVHLSSFIVLLPLLAFGEQKPPVPSIGETIEVSLVNLDVFVTDKTGQRVHGLTKDDFEILENGVRQPVTNFAEYTHESTLTLQTPATPVAAPAPPVRAAVHGYRSRHGEACRGRAGAVLPCGPGDAGAAAARPAAHLAVLGCGAR